MPHAQYVVHRAASQIPLNGDWNDPAWQHAEIAEIASFHPRSSAHHPRTQVKALYDEEGIHLIYKSEDRFVRCVFEKFQDPVCRDSCVEFFVQPAGMPGYFNFEWNCCGTLLCMYITDWQRSGSAFKKYLPLSAEQVAGVRVWHSIDKAPATEIQTPLEWRLQAFIPWATFIQFGGSKPSDKPWRGNFYKCADDSSHPHWGAWSPIGEELNFHQPHKFGLLHF